VPAARRDQTVLGVDGAGGGWVVIRRESDRELTGYWVASFEEILEKEASAAIIAVDIPVGLSRDGSRECDIQAARQLGPRRSSVFRTPIRAALEAESYSAAREVSLLKTGKSVSAQAWNLRKAIFEVDRVATDPRVREVHPEVSFSELNGQPLSSPKKSWDGLQQRLELLRGAGFEPPSSIHHTKAGIDDVVDATVAAWSAARMAQRTAQSIPDPPQRIGDRQVAIWF